MGLFASSFNQSRAGVFGIEQPVPASVSPVGTGTAVIVGAFPWGPEETLTYPDSIGKLYQQFDPAGMDRTNSAYLSVIRKAWPRLGVVRAIKSTSVAASATISSSAPTQLFTVTAICKGSAGNSIILTVGAADDGNSNHFNLVATVSGASGSTVEVYRNLNISGTGADVLPDFTQSVLLGTFTKLAAGLPVQGATTMSGGTTASVTANEYVGTAGAGDDGFALLENDQSIDGVFTDDPGNSLRGTINAGMLAHIVLTSNKIGYINGNSGQSASAAQTDVASYRDVRMVYVDPWAYVFDDITGAKRLAPSSCWAASVAAQIPASLDIGYRAQSQVNMMAGIAQLEADRGSSTGQNTASGISTLIYNPNGGVAFESGVNTSGISGETLLTRSRMGIFMGKSVTQAWAPFVNAPNVQFFQQDLINSLDQFLGSLKSNAAINPAALPYIVDYKIQSPSANNTQASIAAGQYTVGALVETGSSMRQIFLSMLYGPTVQITVS